MNIQKAHISIGLLFVLFACTEKAELKVVDTGIDSSQNITEKKSLDTSFVKALSQGKYSFKISVIESRLTIILDGLTIDNSPIVREIEGIVTDAEIGDLNGDSYPEIFIYTTSEVNGGYAKAYGFSANNGKSMSDIYIPAVADNIEVSKGYKGHDDFGIVEGSLIQRFPIYEEGNSTPSGVTRQIQYRLQDGEASRELVIDKTIEY